MSGDLQACCLEALERLAPEAKTLLLAVSGGVDSVALLRLLAETDLELHVAHFDHALRLESPQDTQFVQTLAETFGLPFHTERADVAQIAEAKGWNVEDAARRLRYRFLTRSAKRVGADAVLTAHTLDDQAETVLMQALRGAAYLKGMPEKQGQVLRPLLNVSKQDLLEYLTELNQPHREDKSNQDTSRTRAWLRRDIISSLQTRYPSLQLTLSRLAQLQRAQAKHFASLAAPFLISDAVAVAELLNQDLAVQREVLAQLLNTDFTHIEAVRTQLESLHPKRISLSRDRTARVAYGRVSVVDNSAKKVGARAISPEEAAGLEPPLDVDKLKAFPDLVWRSRLPGDTIKLAGGSKKLAELLIDLKVPREERDGVALIASGSRILWVEGLAADVKVALTVPDLDEGWMRLALEQADLAAQKGELPIGAVVVSDGELLASAHNETENLNDPSAHAEVLVLRRAAAKLGDWRLADCTLYVTLEPCPMCFGAALQAHLPRIVYGAANQREGALGTVEDLSKSAWKRVPEIRAGVLAQRAGEKLERFFTVRRKS